MGAVRGLVAAVVAVAALAGTVRAQGTTGSASGRVVDSTAQQPLSNVTVSVVGTQIGGLTRPDGRYFLNGIPAGAQRLRVTRIGFAAQERAVTITGGGTATEDFTLTAVAATLSEVVVTGYGSQRREAITGSVSTIQADDANKGVISNPNQLVQGRVTGVNMVTNNGEPGGGAQIRIRGGTSLSASNDPLYVVDGVPLANDNPVPNGTDLGYDHALPRSPLNSINPSDIESITILKDASATAIYGSRGANGVILIQTKRGSVRAAEGLRYETYVAAANPAKKLDYLTGNQYRAFVQQQVTAGTLTASRLAGLGTANTDWEDAVTRTGYAQNHNVSFSGGTQATKYRASLNYFEQQGVVLSNGLKRYQGRLNGLHSTFSGKLGVSLNLTASRVNNDYIPFENGGGFEGGVFTNVAIYNPTRPVTVKDTLTGKTVFFENGAGAQSARNPVALVKQIQDLAPENRVLGNVTATLQILPSLTAQSTIGVDYNTVVRRTYLPRSNAIGAQVGGLARQADRNLQNVNFQQLLTYAPHFGDKQELDIVGGYEHSTYENSGFEVIAQNFITDAFRWNNLGAGAAGSAPPPVSYDEESKLVSFFGRANYGYAGKYFLTGVVRYDGSSRLAEGNKWSIFPALSGSWRLSEEAFMRDSRPLGLSLLALRAGWGVQGNQAVRPYGTQLLLKASSDARYPFGTTLTTGLVASQVANPDLKWETSTQVNVGVDYGFKNDRYTGVLDIYQKTTKDLLLDVSVPQPAVVSTRLENVGSLRNRGVELSLDAHLFEAQRRQLTVGFVGSVERNEVTSLGAGRSFIGTGDVNGQGQSGRLSQRIIVGEPIGTFWGPKFLRVNDKGKQVFSCTKVRPECVGNETTTPSGDDDEIIGKANPDFTLGITSNGRFGAFDASWLWRGEFGRDVFNNTALVYSTKTNVLQDRNFLASALSDPDAVGEPAIYSSRWVESGTFLRLQNVTVGYTFNTRSISRFARSARMFVSGDNLLLFSGYEGYDPEVFVSRGLASRGIDYVTYPRARTFTTGFQFEF